MPPVFVSYNRPDQAYAQELVAYLQRNGFATWLDDRVDFGELRWQEIAAAIRECAAFIAIMTPSGAASLWMQRELALARDLNKPLFPLLLEGESWARLAATPRIDVRNRPLSETPLLDQLAQVAPRQEPAARVKKAAASAAPAGAATEAAEVKTAAAGEQPAEEKTAEAAPPAGAETSGSIEVADVPGAVIPSSAITSDSAPLGVAELLVELGHELRTPLNAVIGFAQTILDFPAMYDDLELPPPYRPDMQNILDSGKRQLAWINSVVDLAEIETGRMHLTRKDVSIAPLIEEVAKDLVLMLGAKANRIRVQSDIAADLPQVYTDERRLRQVLLSLGQMAIALTESGTITLQARFRPPDKLALSIRDTGRGVTLDEMYYIMGHAHVAKPDSNTKAHIRRLGLPIARRLTERLGGKMWLTSQEGAGTTYHVLLPAITP
jgi:signal transduction histidine kinase